jgi:hypothetical protein
VGYGISSNERKLMVLLWVHIRLGGEDDGWMVFELDMRPFWMLKVTERSGRRGGEVELIWTTHVWVWTKGKVRAVNRQGFRVKRISARRERRVVFRTQVKIFPVLRDAGVGIAAHHGRVVPLLVVALRREGRLKVVSSPGDVSPGRVLTAILVVIEVGYIRPNRVGVVELLHERTSRVVGIGNLVWLLPGMVDNWIIMRGVEDVPDRLEVKRGFEVRRRVVVGHVVGRGGSGGGGGGVWSVTVEL